jgi:hypothetical protein
VQKSEVQKGSKGSSAKPTNTKILLRKNIPREQSTYCVQNGTHVMARAGWNATCAVGEGNAAF